METVTDTVASTPAATPSPTVDAPASDAGSSTPDVDMGALSALMGDGDSGDDAGETDTTTAAEDTAVNETPGDDAAGEGNGDVGDEGDDAAAADALPTDETATDTDATTDEPTTDEPAAETKAPAVDPEKAKQDAEAARQAESARAERIGKFQTAFHELKDLLKEGSDAFDPIDHGAKAMKTMMEGLELLSGELAQVQQFTNEIQTTRRNEEQWNAIAKQPEHVGIGAEKLKSIYADEYRKASDEFPDADQKTINALATRAWKGRVKTIAGQIKARAGKTGTTTATTPAKPATPNPKAGITGSAPVRRQPPVTKGGASVTPAPSPQRVPRKEPKTVDEKLDAGMYGDLSKII